MSHQTLGALFVTRDRCPSADPHENPLAWALQSLIGSTGAEAISQWVIIDDGSTDFTTDTVRWIQDKYNVSIDLHSFSGRKGCSYRRAQGIEKLQTDLILMADDDCLFPLTFLSRVLAGWKRAAQDQSNLSVLALPIFEMRTSWLSSILANRIGKTDFDHGWFYHHFDQRPVDEDGTPMSTPFEIDTFSGVILARRSALLQAGNFPDLSCWDTDYSEHLEMAERLRRAGWSFAFLPDEDAGATHLQWGTSRQHLVPAKETDIIFPQCAWTIQQMAQRSAAAAGGGCRVGEEDFLYNRIGSFLSFYLRYYPQWAATYLRTEQANRTLPWELFIRAILAGLEDAHRRKRTDI